jgi:ABC-2 type transport system ATP-binding protein
LQLTLTDVEGSRRAAETLTGLGSGPPRVEPATRSVTLPVSNGPAVLPEVVRRLDAAGLTMVDLALRRPTLDDAFLSLTGRSLPGSGAGDPPQDDAPADGADPEPAGTRGRS